MKKNLFTLSLLILFMSILFVSCKKEDAPAAPSDQTLTLLKNKNWKLTALTVSPAFMGVSDVYPFLEDCVKDNLISFTDPNVVTLNEGALKCDPTDPQVMAGTWVFDAATKTMTTTIDQETTSEVIETISETSFTSKSVEVENGVTYTLRSTYTKQ